MGFWDNILRGFTGTNYMTPRVTYIGGPGGLDDLADLAGVDTTRLTAAQMWRTQPHFRTVVEFLGRNIAQLGVHSFTREGETDRVRDRTSPAAKLFRQPNNSTTTYELIYALVIDLALYDRAYWFVGPSTDTSTGWVAQRLPPAWVETVMADPMNVKEYRVHVGTGKPLTLKPRQVLAFPGHSPGGMTGASPTVESLRETLREQIEASRYRGQVWKRGGRVSAVLQRPKDAPAWSDGAREAFREDWYSKFTGKGSHSGGTPILEDGMTLNRIDFNAQEQQFVEAAKLSLTTVAAAFHVNPTMVGLLDNANYSNVKEFRKMLYGDTLGPTVARIESRFNAFLLPMLGMNSDTTYLEFNIAEKLQGDFLEQAEVLQKLVGRPMFTADEGRARLNMPALGGAAAQVALPVNLTLPDMPGADLTPVEPADVPEPPGEAARAVEGKAGAPRAVKAAPPSDAVLEQHRDALRAFFARQGAGVVSRLGAGDEWWDAQRWDDELTRALEALHDVTADASAREVLTAAGLDPGTYRPAQAAAFLREAARRSAESINGTTREQVAEALTTDEPLEATRSVFEDGAEQRATEISLVAATFAAAFGAVEAGRQAGGGSKTWRTTSPNPRPEHAAMNGETVALDDRFSNGLKWPGAAGPDADQVAGCRCTVDINFS